MTSPDDNYGAAVLDSIEAHLGRYICTTDDADLSVMTLWAASTWLAELLYTSPRLLIDSIMPGSGKTTVLDHLQRLCCRPVQAASISSPALLPRILEHGIRTILIDEVDRSLSPNKPGVEDLLGILNSGYRRGASRPVLVPGKGGEWKVSEMPTFAPVAMAGNSPRLPDDTRSRSIRILLMPDLHGAVEESDWELIEESVGELSDRLAAWAESIAPTLTGGETSLPENCKGRNREKWKPLKRIADAAGGHWPEVADELIRRDLAQQEAENEAGLRAEPPGMAIMRDLAAVWPSDTEFIETKDLVAKVIGKNAEMWGPDCAYGKALTAQRLGRLVSQAAKVTSVRPHTQRPRGYLRSQLEPVWHRLAIKPDNSGSTGYPDTDTGARVSGYPRQPELSGSSKTPETKPDLHLIHAETEESA
ncbi:DUF3631 domain-containing protein [Tsukamurella tyrosinosolvens]|uniref:DUF3631 domain-containing protein n=1 Tax=Tsukamurella tyrosinosolvens TaxID=57704 RepID=UPI003F4A8590